MAIKTVPEGMVYTVERYGRYLKTLQPGLHIITPFADKISFRVNMRERKVRVSFPDLKTKDNQKIIGDADVFVRVTNAHKVAYDNGDVDETLRLKCERAMVKLVKTMSFDEVMAGADNMDEKLLSSIKPHEASWGLQIKYVDIHKIYAAS